MKTVITSSVPTVYQYGSLNRLLVRQPQKHGNGSFSIKIEFNTIREAREWLKERAWQLYEGDKKEIRKNSGKNYLTFDAATAYIRPKTEK